MKITHIIISLALILGSNVATFFITSTSYRVAEEHNKNTISELNKGVQLDFNYINKLNELAQSLAYSNDLLTYLLEKTTNNTLTMEDANKYTKELKTSMEYEGKYVTELKALKEERHNLFSSFKYAKVDQLKTATGSATQ